MSTRSSSRHPPRSDLRSPAAPVAGAVSARERTLPHKVRIIGGQWRRTPLPVIDAPGVRPTPDRVRETVFNWLLHRFGGALEGLTALDLFAGSGALGFEAASRGAERVVLVDSHPAIVRNLRTLCDKLHAEARLDIRQADAQAALGALAAAGARFDVVFLDPPYGSGWLERCLPQVKALLNPDGCVYAEADKALGAAGDTPPGLAGFEILRADKAGQVFYHLLRCKI